MISLVFVSTCLIAIVGAFIARLLIIDVVPSEPFLMADEALTNNVCHWTSHALAVMQQDINNTSSCSAYGLRGRYFIACTILLDVPPPCPPLSVSCIPDMFLP